FPTGDDRHFVFLNARLRRRLGIVQGMRAHVQIQRAPARPPAAVPEELDAELSESRQAKRAWDGLTPAARQVAARSVGSAKSVGVRRFRARDGVRRALRHAAGEGPFYPTTDDQRLLARARRG